MPDTQAAALVAVAGGYASVVFGRALYFGWASSRWPKVTGHVQASAVRVTDFGLRQGRSNLEGLALVTYVYEVRDRIFIGNRIRFGPEWWWFAGRDARAYPSGSRVAVAYDPRSPKRSVLRPGLTWSNVFTFPVGLGVLVAGMVWLIRSLGAS